MRLRDVLVRGGVWKWSGVVKSSRLRESFPFKLVTLVTNLIIPKSHLADSNLWDGRTELPRCQERKLPFEAVAQRGSCTPASKLLYGHRPPATNGGPGTGGWGSTKGASMIRRRREYDNLQLSVNTEYGLQERTTLRIKN
jgi:hypothetical protein